MDQQKPKFRKTTYLIIGNSTAAVGAVEAIRTLDSEGAITVVSSEPYHTYSRPLISYLLCGATDRERMKYRPDDFYTKNNVRLLSGVTALSLDAKAKTVALSDGESIKYEKLLYAGGSEPFLPPFKGLENVKKRFTFMSLDDALALDGALTPDSRVLIVGAGLIGLKCAEGIYGRCASITVCDLADRVLPSILDERGSALVREHIETKGLRFMLGDSADSFEENAADMKSGERVPFDILVLCVGVRPRTAFISEAGGECDRGIVCDSGCRTTLADVWAAGDCAKSHDITTDSDRVLALLPNAYFMGETAGLNMAGGSATLECAMPMNAIGFFGLHIVTAGSYDAETAYVSDSNGNDGNYGNYKRLFRRDGRLVGYIMIGDVARAGIYTSLIREKTPLSEVDFDLLCEAPQLMAFKRADRAEMLGGAKA